MILYHTSYQEIRLPDVHFGRTNADFGQGFYLSDNEEFSRRWARSRPGKDTYEQTVIKSEKAAAALRFVSAEVLLPEEIAQYRAFVSQEEALFQEQFGKLVDGGS